MSILTNVATLYATMSIVSFVLYGWDKLVAVKGSWQRTSERTLLLMDLLCGWPGGLIAQRRFRHKRRKKAYMIRFWAIVTLHVLVWSIIIWRSLFLRARAVGR
jgi:uncharacterized membrane protein YsdA (DUF1294 family)